MSNITKLGLGIICFEGTEHVKNITYELRDLCDNIVVCLQRLSYHGDPIKDDDIKEIEHLKECGLVDDIIWFNPTNYYLNEKEIGPRLVETDKRNYILNYLEFDKKCSHSLIIDSDEFYDKTDFIKTKNIISENDDIHITYCQYINYYRDYKHLLIWPMISYVPFITESRFRFKYGEGNFNKPSDPTRRYLITDEQKIYHILPFSLIKMHHLSWIRKDISKKISSWSAKKYFEHVKNLEEAMIDRYNNYVDGDNAVIMLNVPNFEVCVNILPKQYIHPHYNIDDIATKYIKQ